MEAENTTTPRLGTAALSVDPRGLTLRAFAALRGYEEQRELVAAIEKRGESIPKSAVSEMFRGGLAFPKARTLVGLVLFPELRLPHERDALLLTLIANAARRAERLDAAS